MLVDPDEQDALNLVALRPMLEPAIAFATEGVSGTVLELLEEADWRVMHVRRPAEIGGAWAGIAATARDRATIGAVGDVPGTGAPDAGRPDGRAIDAP